MPLSCLPPFAATSGPQKAKVMLLGEAWGASEETAKRPFVGESGKLLFEALGQAFPVAQDLHSRIRSGPSWSIEREAWLAEASILMTNVFALRPPANDLGALCLPRADMPTTMKGNQEFARLPPLVRGKFLDPQWWPELRRLHQEISICAPNIVVALGNTATWALLQTQAIGNIRGATTLASGLIAPKSQKVLPTYHPAAITRQWSWRPILVADLMKAHRESARATLERVERQILISPSIEECETWTSETLSRPPALLACDIETTKGQISSVAFARSPTSILVVPFITIGTILDSSYWPTPQSEERAWICCKDLLENSEIKKLFQNGLYDLQYISRMGIAPRACLHDTMLLHHSLFPEMQKGLGFLGSIYSSEAAWKLMRRNKPDSEKRDE